MIFTYTSDLEKWLKVTVHSIPNSTLWRQCWKHLYFNCFFFLTEVKPTWLLRQSRWVPLPVPLTVPESWLPPWIEDQWQHTERLPQRFQHSWLGIKNHIHFDHKNYCNLSKICELKAQVTSLGNKGAFISLLLEKNMFVVLCSITMSWITLPYMTSHLWQAGL